MKKRKEQKTTSRKFAIIVILAVIVVIIAVITGSLWIKYADYNNKVDAYNEAVSDYNIAAQSYINLIQNTSTDNIDGMPKKLTYEKDIKKNIWVYLKNMLTFSGVNKVEKDKKTLEHKTEELVSSYLIAQQITNPTSEWTSIRLKEIEKLTGVQSVTKEYDPNGLLGKKGGYTGCVYFSVSDINQGKIQGNDIVAKGTDCGGCIEIYENEKDAMSRCDYLAQFDNTLIYSGSYTIVGTMVVRTSYMLSNEQQTELTNEITARLTELK